MYELKTEAKLQKGDQVTAVVINFSLGGHFHNYPVAFPKTLIFDGIDPTNGEPKWLEPYMEISGGNYSTAKTRPYNHGENFFVIGILPERVYCGKDNIWKGQSFWKKLFKVEEVILEDSE